MIDCKCGAKSDVLDSRQENGTMRRRRRCPRCGARWSTLEVEASLRVSGPSHRGGEPEATRGHSAVVTFFRAKKESGVSYEEISRKSGVPVKTIKNWKRHPAPTLINIDAALTVLGYELAAVRR